MKYSDVTPQSVGELSVVSGSDSPGAGGRGLYSLRIALLPFHRLLVVFLNLIYAVMLVGIVRWLLAVKFSYEGYGYFPLERLDLLLWTWGMVLLPSMFLPIQMRKPSQFLVWILMLIVYIPGILIPPYALGYRYEYAPYQCVLFVCMAVLCGVGLLPSIRIPAVRWSFRAYVIGLLAYSALIMGWIVSQVGLPTSIPSFAEVYVQRAAYGEAMSSPGPLSYLIAWQTSVINPILILIGLTRKRWLIAGTGIGLNVLMYALAGHKSHLLASVLVIGVFVLLGLVSHLRGILLAAGAVSLIAITTILYALLDLIYPVSIFVRRMIAVPGMLTGFYFDYFSDFGFTGRFGPLSIFLDQADMKLTTPKTIGLAYFGNEDTAANANFWADAFSAIGFPGMALATILLVLILWVMDSLTVSRPARIATPLFVVAMYSLTNSALPTSLLTHGILFTILMILLFPTSTSNEHAQDRQNEAEAAVAPSTS